MGQRAFARRFGDKQALLFLKKKKQKNFTHGFADPALSTPMDESFLLLFSKKKRLLPT
jgi:hypothetical protein